MKISLENGLARDRPEILLQQKLHLLQTTLKLPGMTTQIRKDLISMRSLGQWRPKQVTISETSLKPPHVEAGPPSDELAVVAQLQQPSGDVRAVTREAVMEDLHEVTRQYLSCADPVEAADLAFNAILSPDPSTILSPQQREEESEGLVPCASDDAHPVDNTPLRREVGAKKIKSIIVSPEGEQPEPHQVPKSPLVQQEDNKILQDF
ncbi:hypothetical protein DY000_02050475 [Brassica cretica]|uniref:Uncharacterized protein n=1 Tax=Brassica cretica TaxID=69181 RepID=A0ABQ7ERK8_BRACR|nr:hypothetical protein DY000_02050475 [Brassica cretica]